MGSHGWTVVLALGLLVWQALAEIPALDASNNHLGDGRGAANTAFVRIVPTLAGEEIDVLTAPLPRLVSETIGSVPLPNNRDGISAGMLVWGQLMTHDLQFTANSGSVVSAVPTCDAVLDETCTGNATFTIPGDLPAAPFNLASSFLDAAPVYGVDPAHAAMVRTFEGGHLNMSGEGRMYPRYDPDIHGFVALPPFGKDPFFSGDPRGNAVPPVMAMLTIWGREHNRLADAYAAADPSLTDEELYQKARRFVMALWQRVTFFEYMPILLGQRLPDYSGYDDSVDPSLDLFFSTVAFRYGHSALTTLLFRVGPDWELASEPATLLRDAFFDGSHLDSSESVDEFLRGLVWQPENQIDTNIVEDMRNFFGAGDIFTTNIMRGRDRGLPNYNAARAHLGLPTFASFAEFVAASPKLDPGVAADLEALYGGDINNVDAYVGGLAETPVVGTLGPLFNASVVDQLMRSRAGDRFWYEREGLLTAHELDEVHATTLSDIVIRNSDTIDGTGMPSSLFQVRPGLPPALAGSLIPLPGYNFEWSVHDGNVLSVRLAAEQTSGFLGVGFGSTPMIDVDLVVCVVDDAGGVDIFDGHSNSFFPERDVELGASDDLTVTLAVVQDGWLQCEFDRTFVTGDGTDFAISAAAGESTPMFFARNTDALGYHTLTGRRRLDVDLLAGTAVSELTTLLTQVTIWAHGAVMFGTWAIMFPLGVISVRHYKHNDNWLVVHKRLQSTGIFTALLTVMYAVFTSAGAFLTTHHTIGVIMSGGILLQALDGFGIAWLVDAKVNLSPWVHPVIRLLHRLFGATLLFVSIPQMRLGIELLFPDNDTIALVYWVWMGAVYIVLVYFEIVKCIHQRARTRDIARGLNLNLAGAHLPTMTWTEFTSLVRGGAQWMVIDGLVVDVANFAGSHPGGRGLLLNHIGTEVTLEIAGIHHDPAVSAHAHTKRARDKMLSLALYRIGNYRPVADWEKLFKNRRSHALVQGALGHLFELTSERFNKFRLSEKTMVGADLCLLKFTSKTKKREFDIEPGQHVKIHAMIANSGVEREYTPLKDHDDDPFSFHLAIRVYPNGTMTSYLNELSVGNLVSMRGPLGPSLVNPTDPNGLYTHLVIVVGGTGITPGMQLLQHYARVMELSGSLSTMSDGSGAPPLMANRTVAVVYANRSPASSLFIDQLRAYRRRGIITNLTLVFSGSTKGTGTGTAASLDASWSEVDAVERGFVTAAILQNAIPSVLRNKRVKRIRQRVRRSGRRSNPIARDPRGGITSTSSSSGAQSSDSSSVSSDMSTEYEPNSLPLDRTVEVSESRIVLSGPPAMIRAVGNALDELAVPHQCVAAPGLSDDQVWSHRSAGSNSSLGGTFGGQMTTSQVTKTLSRSRKPAVVPPGGGGGGGGGDGQTSSGSSSEEKDSMAVQSKSLKANTAALAFGGHRSSSARRARSGRRSARRRLGQSRAYAEAPSSRSDRPPVRPELTVETVESGSSS